MKFRKEKLHFSKKTPPKSHNPVRVKTKNIQNVRNRTQSKFIFVTVKLEVFYNYNSVVNKIWMFCTAIKEIQSSAYQFGSSLFQDSGETIRSVEINDTSYERHADFHLEKTKTFFFEKPNNKKPKPKKGSFLALSKIICTRLQCNAGLWIWLKIFMQILLLKKVQFLAEEVDKTTFISLKYTSKARILILGLSEERESFDKLCS